MCRGCPGRLRCRAGLRKVDTELRAGRGPGGRPRTRCSGSQDEAQPGGHGGPSSCESAPPALCPTPSRPQGPGALDPLPLRGPTSLVQAGATGRLGATPTASEQCPLPAASLALPASWAGLSFPVSPRGCLHFPMLRVSARCPALQDEASSDHDGPNHHPVTSHEADETPRPFPHLWAGVPSQESRQRACGCSWAPLAPPMPLQTRPSWCPWPIPSGTLSRPGPPYPSVTRPPGQKLREDQGAGQALGGQGELRALGTLLPAPPGPPRPLTQAASHPYPPGRGRGRERPPDLAAQLRLRQHPQR